jgi:hypothetical protein
VHTKGRVSATLIAGALVLGGAYVGADGADVVPGFLTFKAPLPRVAPFPDSPVLSPEPTEIPLFAKSTNFDANTYKALVREFATDYRLANAKLSFWVGDRDGVELASHEPQSALTAASTTKLLTAVAALHEFGPDARARTVVAWDNDKRKLFLIGGGDMLLGAGADTPRSVKGYAGLDTLAADTIVALSAQTPGNTKPAAGGPPPSSAKKSKSATPNSPASRDKSPADSLLNGKPYTLVLDTSWFGSQTASPSWRDGDDRWVGPIQGMAINTGLVDPNAYRGYQSDPAGVAGQAFAQALSRLGGDGPAKVEVGKSGLASKELLDPLSPLPKVSTEVSASHGPVPIAYAQGAPLAQVERQMLKISDNTLAESLGRLVALHRNAKPTFADSGAAVMDSLRELGVDLGKTELKGCSGLAYETRIPARVLADVVRLATSRDHPELHSVTANVPVAGADGTLEHTYQGTLAAGVVRGKTGTLAITNSLAGTFVRDNQEFIYALVISGYPESQGGPSIEAKQIFINGLLGAKTSFSKVDPKSQPPDSPPDAPAPSSPDASAE